MDLASGNDLAPALTMLVMFAHERGVRPGRRALVEHDGALQRITVSIGFVWLTALGVHALRTAAGRQSRQHTLG